MQKIINVIALSAGVVSLAVVGLGGYVFIRKDAIIEDIKEKAMESVLGGGIGGAGLGIAPSLPLGSNDLAPSAPQMAPPSSPVPGGERAMGMGSPL